MRTIKTRHFTGTTDNTVTKRELDNRKVVRRAAAEGMVLLKNEGILPLKEGTKIALYGVGAEEVKNLASEIKSLVSSVDGSIVEVEQDTENLNHSITTSKESLGKSLESADETYEVFDRITTAAGGADQVQQEIAKVLDDSREKLADVNGSLEREKAEYDTVCLHIERANDLGTQKSTMFENMENLLVQIAPIAKELEQKN